MTFGDVIKQSIAAGTTQQKPPGEAIDQSSAGLLTDPRWRDPSGWRPYPLQMSVSPERTGLTFERWSRDQVICRSEDVAVWISMHNADAVLASKAKKKSEVVARSRVPVVLQR